MNRKQALTVLGLDKALTTLTTEIVAQAFRAAAKASHPDANLPAERPLHPAIDLRDSQPADMDKLTEAKKILLAELICADSACKLCLGLGMVPSKMGYRACVACRGTGERQ